MKFGMTLLKQLRVRRTWKPVERGQLAGGRAVLLCSPEDRLRQLASKLDISKREAERSIPVDANLAERLVSLGTCKDAPSSDFKIFQDLASKTPRRKHKSAQGIFAPAMIQRQYSLDPKLVATGSQDIHNPVFPEVCFAGQSNVGKSRLINCLAQSHLVAVKSVRGHTRSLDFYTMGMSHITIEELKRRLKTDSLTTAQRKAVYGTFIDIPGYGFTDGHISAPEKQHWMTAIRKLLISRSAVLKQKEAETLRAISGSGCKGVYSGSMKHAGLSRVFLLVDARFGFRQSDLDFMELLQSVSLPFQVVFTKADLVHSRELATRIHLAESTLLHFRVAIRDILPVSAATEAGVHRLRRVVYSCWGFKKLPHPKPIPQELQQKLDAVRQEMRTVMSGHSKSTGLKKHNRRYLALRSKLKLLELECKFM